jgi:hypothetical protein
MASMTPEAHRAYTARLLARLAGEADVLGLVTLGSTSGQPPLPDDFSDHDFFVVTRPGAQERFRADLSWLPEGDPVVLAFRETAHGVKALLASGHLAEFAVFDPEELSLARVNRYAVPLDRADVAARLARVRQATVAAGLAAPALDERWQAGQLLTCLVVGAGRAGRGERLSGHWLVRAAALGHLVTLLRARLAPRAAARLDDLDPYRRLEEALPEVAAELEAALRLPLPAAARALLALLARERPELVAPAARLAVERALDRAAPAAGPAT